IDKDEEKLFEDSLLKELSKDIKDLNFSGPMQIKEYLGILDENVVYKVPDNNQIISNLIEIFRERPDKIEDEDPEGQMIVLKKKS
ncbi:1190_t:CDS:1, partial [Dentiscutata heterogama]